MTILQRVAACLLLLAAISGMSACGAGGSTGSGEGDASLPTPQDLYGEWRSGGGTGSTLLRFDASTYRMTLEGQVFDTGTWVLQGTSLTMISNGGHSSTGEIYLFPDGCRLNGLHNGYGQATTYRRVNCS